MSVASTEPGSASRQCPLGVAPLQVMPVPDLPPGAPSLLRAIGYSLLRHDGSDLVLVAENDTSLYGIPRDSAAEGPYAQPVHRRDMGALVLAAQIVQGLCAVVLWDEGTLRLRVLQNLRSPEMVTADLATMPHPPSGVRMAASPGGGLVAVAVPPAREALAQGEETLVWILPATHALAAPPAALKALGMPVAHRNALCFSGEDTLWLVSRSREDRRGYLTQWCITSGSEGRRGWEKSAEHLAPSLPPDAVAAPTGSPLDGILVSQGDVLGLWTGAGMLWEQSFGARVGALAMAEGAILCGAGGALQVLSLQDGAPGEQRRFDTGHVIDILPPSAGLLGAVERDLDLDGLYNDQEAERRADIGKPDSDVDGICDSLDPRPADQSPCLRLPESIVFSGKAAGRELRGLRIASPNGAPLQWRAAVDPETLPWVRVYPREGDSATPMYLGVDPVEARRGTLNPGAIAIMATDATGVEAAGSPHYLEVSVATVPRAARTVLWLRAPAGPAIDAAQATLSAPPLYLSHRTQEGPYTGGMEDIAVAALSLAAAGQGMLSQREAVDYVMQGGAMLLYGDAPQSHELAYLLHWGEDFGIAQSEEAGITLAGARPPDGKAPALHGEVGAGRVAYLPDLEDPTQLEQAFSWLCAAGVERADLDNDGLSDGTEDANGNHQREPEETDPLNPDSDGDGLPDGLEDRNGNGVVDEGESSPLNPDSDGDGAWDGAEEV